MLFLKYIKNHLNVAFRFCKIFCYGFHRDFCGLLIRETENPGRNAAESDASDAVLVCHLQAGTVTGCQLIAVLTVQLREMEAQGLVSRKVYAEVPPRVEYTLTETGYSLKSVLDAMWAWGEEYKAKNEK